MLQQNQAEFRPLIDSISQLEMVIQSIGAIRESVITSGSISRDQAKVLKNLVGELSDCSAMFSTSLRKANAKVFALQPGER